MKTQVLLNVVSSRVPAVFAVIALVLAPPILAGTPELKSETQAQQLAYLIEIKRQIPELFKDAAKYDIELFTLLENQAELLHQLKQIPEYQTLLSQKKYIDLTVTPPPEGISVGYTEIKPEAVRAWKSELTQTAKELESSGVTTPDHLKSTIVKLLKGLHPIADPNKLLSKTGYIEKTGTTEKATQAFRDRVKALKPKNDLFHHECEHGQTTLLGKLECVHSHYEELEGLPYLPSREQLDEAIDQIRTEQKLYALAEFSALAQAKAWKDFKKATVDDLAADDLVFLDDRNDALKPLLAQSLEGLPESQFEFILNGVHSNMRSYASQAVTHPHLETAPVRIVEVPPEIGIFRGFTGGDCSSQYSFPYPNDPQERVFFIHEGSEPPKGYVSATEVTLANGDKGLYVITISGCRVSPGNTDLILRGLEQAKAELGVKHILLPKSEKMAELINFPGIRGVYSKYIRKGKPEPITYQARAIREQIESFSPESEYNKGDYDHMDGNKMAVRFRADNQSLGLKTQVSPKQNTGVQPKSFDKISNQEILDFVLDLHYSNRTITKDLVLSIPEVEEKLDTDQLESALSLFNSCWVSQRYLTIQEYKTKLDQSLLAAGFLPGFLAANSHYLYPGLLTCADAFSDENKEETAQAILNYYRERGHNPGIAIFELSREKKMALESTAVFQSFYKKLASDLKNADSKIRLRAAEASKAFLPSQGQVDLALIEALKDPEEAVSAASNAALEGIKPTSEAVLQALVQLLPQEHLYKNYASALLGLIKPADPKVHWALVKALKGQDNQSRVSVVRALGQIRPKDPKIYDAIAALLEEKNDKLRVTAIQELGKLLPQDSKINVTLAPLLNDPSPVIRNATVDAFRLIRPTDPGILLSLIEIFKNPKEEEEMRKAAQIALTVTGSEDAKIQQALANLAGIGTEEVAETEFYFNLSRQAGHILGTFEKLDPDVFASMIKRLEDPEGEVRRRAVWMLGRLAGHAEVQVALVKMFSDPKSFVALNASQALEGQKILDRRVFAALLQSLQSNGNESKSLALEVLTENRILLDPKDELYLKIQKILRPLLKDRNPGLRNQAVGAFYNMQARVEDSETYLTLVHLLKDPNPDTQFNARLILAASNPVDPKVFQSLINILRHTDKEIRNSAAEVLKQITRKASTPPFTGRHQNIFGCVIKSGHPISSSNYTQLMTVLNLTNGASQ